MNKKKPPRISVSVYMTSDVRENLRKAYGKMITDGYSESEQHFLHDALCIGAKALCGCVNLHDGNNMRTG